MQGDLVNKGVQTRQTATKGLTKTPETSQVTSQKR